MIKNMIKLVAIDIDGTLLDSKKCLSEENLNTIKGYEKKGVKFAFSTGRVDRELEDVAAQLPCIKYGIMCNGAYVIDFENNKVLYSDFFEMSDVKNIYDLVKKLDVDMMFELQADGVVYSEKRCIENTYRYNVGHIDEFIKRTRVAVDDMGEYILSRKNVVAKINIFFPSVQIRDEVLKKIKNIDYDLAYSEGSNIEFNLKGTTKARGLVALAEYLGLDMDETMAIGDNYNDVDILKATKNSVVMGNAKEEIKKLGNYITLTNDESGVAYAIKELIK